MATILSNPFFIEQVLPFLLVFTLVFAILDKTKVLGEGKRQVNAIIAFVIGIILIAFPGPRDLIVNLMPLLAIIAVVMLVFLMFYGFAGGKPEDKWVKIVFGGLVGLALIVALLVFTGYWESVLGAVSGGEGSGLAANVIFILIIIAAVAIVLWKGKGGGSSSE